ncbi:ribosome recycling factor [Jeotgalibaca porci]|uniref:Ribosome-recycling factor n=1 Tax=Jeotgalibaca porci TaxID=1868793 RepID=A0A6G7WEN6_9LACT|nr:ribosome recycling factor [Jeotgalibaca porci]NLB98579.1 ribosome recycling factor [Lactobacillales bacterium]QIK50686.1 ribosome recycling factor [Jeotgalibaca porci]
MKDILNNATDRMKKAEASLERELGSIRAGVANASLLDRIEVEYYGALTPVNQLASINIPEARMLTITPYDKSSLGDIERAIYQSDLGISPTNDGTLIRLVIPALTEERRKDLAKLVGKNSENAKVAVRNIRRDAMDALKKAEKSGDISEDELHVNEKKVQELTDASTKRIDEIAAKKETELLDK